jgi:general secretion pathway protein A
MYESYYGLRERPFSPSPNPRFLLLTPGYREALTQIECGIAERQPITLLLGPPGTGKTTLLRAAAEKCRAMGDLIVWVANSSLSRAEWNEWLAAGFGLDASAAGSKARCLWELQNLLGDRLRRGLGTALIVDEAQTLSPELLEEIRQLTNLETSAMKLLPVVMGATPELGDRLRQGQYAALKQRVSLRCSLAPLDLQGTAAYIEGRLHIAGGSGESVFTADTVREIYTRSGGVPRVINLLCENALITGFALRQRPIEPAVVGEVGADFDLPESAPAQAAPPGSVRDARALTAPAPTRPAKVPLRLTFDPAATAAALPVDARAQVASNPGWYRRRNLLGLFAFSKRG